MSKRSECGRPLVTGETVTIPSLPDAQEWKAFNASRLVLKPRLSLRHAAPRYKMATA